MQKNASAKEVQATTEKGLKLAEELDKINHKLNRNGAKLITLGKVKPYRPAPEEVEKASETVLTKHKDTGLNVAGWIRAVNLETAGRYSEAQLKEYLETLIGDEAINEEKAIGGKSREKKLTLNEE